MCWSILKARLQLLSPLETKLAQLIVFLRSLDLFCTTLLEHIPIMAAYHFYPSLYENVRLTQSKFATKICNYEMKYLLCFCPIKEEAGG